MKKEYLKMADVFFNEVVSDSDCMLNKDLGEIADFSGYKKECRYAAHAINSHDELVEHNGLLLSALQRLISSDPHIAMFPTSELEACTNNDALTPTLREQAASVIQARGAISIVNGV